MNARKEPAALHLPRLANSLDRFLDIESANLVGILTSTYSHYNHVLANEPTIAMYRIGEHVRKSVPLLEQRRLELLKNEMKSNENLFDIEFALESVALWTEKKTQQKYAALNIRASDAIRKCKMALNTVTASPSKPNNSNQQRQKRLQPVQLEQQQSQKAEQLSVDNITFPTPSSVAAAAIASQTVSSEEQPPSEQSNTPETSITHQNNGYIHSEIEQISSIKNQTSQTATAETEDVLLSEQSSNLAINDQSESNETSWPTPIVLNNTTAGNMEDSNDMKSLSSNKPSNGGTKKKRKKKKTEQTNPSSLTPRQF